MNEQPRAIDKLVYLVCGEDDKMYQELARGMVDFSSYCKRMNDLLYSEFKGQTFEEFESWKEERAKNYHMVSKTYEKLKYRAFPWIT